ncbi:chemotaxis protein : Methyl-accepting chemotaxis sensory transducer OS=Rhodothermus marinus (strain ATCC 43812 / DSM 4252 / R-10) GN=Rmar_2782 PE=4 SV=1: MCPsignal [Gemmata massiliana]|uniref:Methyl-accepting transducer domain-containing protein n=1 Tax=Gemmata massiliana TaxID=1210884 RepID=A0A6P2DAQ0_9BACT|nr:methyl-accepting chemotaxis protein [Gemmata massiliana]VTR97646.1 chemotaxis protein : Methyl-accepting chemotaxis sensory transducer OS=Rhodothermus marinus (strain ATCC 43812 / DSM 4252 / R-10) GN=Rmar_2782 PE=4 SV=1: MCPsignal [Gemmata massiliana]
MSAAPLKPATAQAEELFRTAVTNNRARADRLFAGLMVAQWVLVIVLALVVSPRAWAGAESGTHLHVWVAVLLGAICAAAPAYLAVNKPGDMANGFVVAISQMVMGILIMHLTGGRIESHFHVFASIGMLAVYRDWRVVVLAVAVAAVDHIARGFLWWQSAYGSSPPSDWLWLEHAAWALFSMPVLAWMCVLSTDEMRAQAAREAALAEAEREAGANVQAIATQAQEMRERAEREATEQVTREVESELARQAERQQAEELRRKADVILAGINALAAGDFTHQTPEMGTDVIGQMAAALNKAAVAVREALEGVREVSEQLADASGQLSAASEEISTGAQEQASSLEETASTLEQITARVRQNSDSAQQARQLANNSKEVAEKGGQVVGSAVTAMSAINESSKRIADIITTIDEIAFQTNLLALNAAVEAARAGEQGRGFAVVASEVRNLAQRSATAAKEIKDLIEDSVKKVDVGTELVNRSGTTLGDIVTSVKRVTDLITEIAAAGKEQSTGIDQVSKAISQMDEVTQRNAAQTEEMSATAQTLTDQATQLRGLVARFQLGHDGGIAPSRPTRGTRPKAKAPAHKPRPVASRSVKVKRPSHELDRLGSGGDDGFTEF